MKKDYLENGEDSNYLPEPNAAREEIERIVTGGRVGPADSYRDLRNFLIGEVPEEVKLKRALLAMNIRDGHKPASELSKFDNTVLMISEASITPYFKSIPGSRPGDKVIELDIGSNF